MSANVNSEQVLGDRSFISVIAFLRLASRHLCSLRFNLQHVFHVRLSPDSSSSYPPRPPETPEIPQDPPRPPETHRDPPRPTETTETPPRPPATESRGGACVSLAGATTSIIFVATEHGFCRDKNMFVATNIILSRQKTFCRDKNDTYASSR